MRQVHGARADGQRELRALDQQLAAAPELYSRISAAWVAEKEDMPTALPPFTFLKSISHSAKEYSGAEADAAGDEEALCHG